VHTSRAWASGVSVGLTPAGTRALLGAAMPELVDVTAPLADVLGPGDGELADRLHAAPDWPSRFAVVDRLLMSRLTVARPPDSRVMTAWTVLQRAGRPPRVGVLADSLGVSRRALELGFRRQVGLSPGAVARVARFQRAIALLGRPTGLARVAADCGYTDQPHFTRDMRRMAGLSPTELFAFVQYRRPPGP
jgi:AraC-like DNA-binding protein